MRSLPLHLLTLTLALALALKLTSKLTLKGGSSKSVARHPKTCIVFGVAQAATARSVVSYGRK